MTKSSFILNGGTFRSSVLPARFVGFLAIVLLLRYTFMNVGDTVISRNPVLYFGLLLGISLGIYMLTVNPITGLVAKNAQALEILEEFIGEENKRLDFLVELKLHKEGSVVHPANGKGPALFHLERKDKINILKISQ